jgi:hypothetical protein
MVRASLRVASLAAVAVLAGGLAASAQSIPVSKASRELVRRVLLDACVYQETAKMEPEAEGGDKDKAKSSADKRSAAQQKIVDACQCASTRAMKPVKDEEVAKVDETRQVPDAWYAATTEAYPACRR